MGGPWATAAANITSSLGGNTASLVLVGAANATGLIVGVARAGPAGAPPGAATVYACPDARLALFEISGATHLRDRPDCRWRLVRDPRTWSRSRSRLGPGKHRAAGPGRRLGGPQVCALHCRGDRSGTRIVDTGRVAGKQPKPDAEPDAEPNPYAVADPFADADPLADTQSHAIADPEPDASRHRSGGSWGD